VVDVGGDDSGYNDGDGGGSDNHDNDA